jgi:hypothetical protein
MSQKNGQSGQTSNFKENKFNEEEPIMKAGKAAKYTPSVNETPKQNNPQ